MVIIDANKVNKILYGISESESVDVTEVILQYLSSHFILNADVDIHQVTKIDPYIGKQKNMYIYDKSGTYCTLSECDRQLSDMLVLSSFATMIRDAVTPIKGRTVVLTFINSVYMPIFDIFYAYFRKLSLGNLLVVSLDRSSFDKLRGESVNTILIPYCINNFTKFWRFRLVVTKAIFLTTRRDILHTDSDCIWLKDILPLIENNDYDLLGQIEHGRPLKISSKFGFVICCGFYRLKYSDKTVNFFDNLIATGVEDDQDALNEYVFNNREYIKFSLPTFAFEKEILLKSGIKVGVINSGICRRNRFNSSLYIYHPWLPSSDINSKVKDLKNRIHIV
jgi:hypothetical protein